MKLFTSATVKLAGWYLLILIIVSLLFSSIIFQVARSEVDTQLHKLVVQQDDRPEPQQYIADHISTSTNNLLVSLGYINLVVLLAGGACSYLLARITLRPIELAHNAQSRFVSNASHQLRTPLAIMKAETELALQHKATTKKELREILSSNLEEINKLNELSTMLLELSRTESMLASKGKSFNLVEIIQELISDRKAAEQVQFTGPDTITVTLHHTATRELCAILLDNALKHSPESSVVNISATATKSSVIIRITNDGEIAKQTLPHIFEQFFRGSQQTKGYGLGLPLAEQLSKALGGTISVSSAKKQTTFCLSLPKA